MKVVLRAMLVLAALTLGHVPASNAALLFENYTPSSFSFSGSLTGTRGTEFTVGPQSLSVIKLGTFSVASTDMDIGIWRVSDQTLVGSVTVPLGGGTSMQGWNFASVTTPLTLLANTVYRIGAETEIPTIGVGGTFSLGSGIASISDGHVFGPPPGLAYPNVVDNVRLFTANAEIMPIPEPSSVALLLAGLAGLWFARRRII